MPTSLQLPTMKLDESARRAARAAFGIAPDADPIEWFRVGEIVNVAGPKPKTTVEILIYDVIDPWGVSANEFAKVLNGLDVDEIVVGINSPGGIVFDGIAIMNALKRHPANVIARIDSLAASAASFIAMAGDEVHASKYAEMMIHEAWGAVRGNAEDMKAMFDLLLRHNQSIASVYADHAGGDVKHWLKLMKSETWFTAEEMVAAGLADKIIEAADESSEADETDSSKNRFDLSVFNYAGRQQAPAPAIRNSTEQTPRKEAKMATTKEHLAEKFGLDPALDDDAFNEALDGKLAENAAAAAAPPAGSPAEPTAEQMRAKADALGFAWVDKDTLDALKTQAQQGSDAYNSLRAERDAQMVDDAVRAGKIAPASRDKWIKNLAGPARDDYAQALADAEAVFPVQEAGHGMNPDPAGEMRAPEDLAWFDSAPTSGPDDDDSEGK